MYINYFSITISIGLIVSFILFYKFPILKQFNANNKNIKISIIIPVRNEEKNIRNILSDINRQTYNIYQIICVDDNSSDNSAKIIKEFDNVEYIYLNDLEEGWKGKPWASQNGAKAAKGEVLLFLDADVRLKESAIESLISIYERNNKPISVQPFHKVYRFYEYFSYFFNLIQICATSMSVYNRTSYNGFYGPVFLIDKKLFLKNGGYEKVRNNVLEDLHLAKYYKSKDIDIELMMGSDEIQFTMYPNGFFQLLEGWSKNFSQACASVDVKLFFMVFLWIGYLISIPIEISKAIVFNNYYGLHFLIAIYVLSVLKLRKDTKKIGSFPLIISILYPFFLLGFVLIFFISIIKTYIFKNTTWKGRRM